MFYERFVELCKKRGISPAAATREMGLNNSSSTTWKRGAIPKGKTLEKLAEYFGVSVNYLLGYETERVIIPGRLKIVEINDPKSDYIRSEIRATDEEAFKLGWQMLENENIPAQDYTPQALVLAAMEQLNYDGQQKAVERVRELTEISRYRLRPSAQPPSAALGAADTTAATESPDREKPEGE